MKGFLDSKYGLFLITWFFIGSQSFCVPALSAEPFSTQREITVAILVQKQIVQFVQAVEALAATLHSEVQIDIDVDVFYMDNYVNGANELAQKLRLSNYDAYVAIGPEAAKLIWSDPLHIDGPKIYAMILSPESVIDPQKRPCGVPLSIDIGVQLKTIREAFPTVKRIGILFNPADTGDFFNSAASVGDGLGLDMIPLNVSSMKEISHVLSKNWQNLDALWLIPDQTVTFEGSERIIQFIIDEAILHKIPVIGYNRFFYESNAGLSFVLDYRGIGKQTAELLIQTLNGTPCIDESPEFDAWINIRTVRHLGIEYRTNGKIKVGP